MFSDVPHVWTPILPSSAVTKAPQRVMLGATPLVVWRARQGRPVVFIDVCPHKDFPLSEGRRTFTGRLVCEVHGWEFDAEGTCVRAPGRTREQIGGRHAKVVPCREADGRLWVFPGSAEDAGLVDRAPA